MFFFFFNDTATTEIYTLSLHDALPIYRGGQAGRGVEEHEVAVRRRLAAQADRVHGGHDEGPVPGPRALEPQDELDRKSTRLNSSHANLVCRLLLEKKKKANTQTTKHV